MAAVRGPAPRESSLINSMVWLQQKRKEAEREGEQQVAAVKPLVVWDAAKRASVVAAETAPLRAGPRTALEEWQQQKAALLPTTTFTGGDSAGAGGCGAAAGACAASAAGAAPTAPAPAPWHVAFSHKLSVSIPRAASAGCLGSCPSPTPAVDGALASLRQAQSCFLNAGDERPWSHAAAVEAFATAAAAVHSRSGSPLSVTSPLPLAAAKSPPGGGDGAGAGAAACRSCPALPPLQLGPLSAGPAARSPGLYRGSSQQGKPVAPMETPRPPSAFGRVDDSCEEEHVSWAPCSVLGAARIEGDSLTHLTASPNATRAPLGTSASPAAAALRGGKGPARRSASLSSAAGFKQAPARLARQGAA